MYKECIEDCSKGLQSGLTHIGTEYQVSFLMRRCLSLEKLGQYDEAVRDFRAAIASFRLVKQYWEGFPSLKDAKNALFFTICNQKVGSPRPHFSDEERDSLLKDIEAGHYHKDHRKCLECGQRPTTDVPLSLCLGCRRVWFCNKTCQRKAWKSGHKERCKATILNTMIGDIDEMNQKLADGGYLIGHHKNSEPIYVTQDPVTGRLFNSLRDNEVADLGEIGVGANGRLFLQRDRSVEIDSDSSFSLA